MRILVYGAGVLGSFLAHNLYAGKKDVTLLARGAWARKIKENGLTIKHKARWKTTQDGIRVIEALLPEDRYDVIFVAMQYTQISAILPCLRANCSETVVLIGNNMTAEQVAAQLPDKRVLFAFTTVGGRREDCKAICVYLNKALTVGSLDGDSSYRPLIEEAFCELRYKIAYCDKMGDWLKSHAAVILPIAYACYFADGNLKTVAKNKAFLHKMVDATREGYNVLQAAGYTVLPEEDYRYVMEKGKSYYRLLKLMCATFIGKLAASDHAMSAVGEMTAISDAFDEIIARTSVPVPAWEELRQYLFRKIGRDRG